MTYIITNCLFYLYYENILIIILDGKLSTVIHFTSNLNTCKFK